MARPRMSQGVPVKVMPRPEGGPLNRAMTMYRAMLKGDRRSDEEDVSLVLSTDEVMERVEKIR
jgi:hypothetical protein